MSSVSAGITCALNLSDVCVCVCLFYSLSIDSQCGVCVYVCVGIDRILSHRKPCMNVCAGICCALSNNEVCVCLCVLYTLSIESL